MNLLSREYGWLPGCWLKVYWRGSLLVVICLKLYINICWAILLLSRTLFIMITLCIVDYSICLIIVLEMTLLSIKSLLLCNRSHHNCPSLNWCLVGLVFTLMTRIRHYIAKNCIFIIIIIIIIINNIYIYIYNYNCYL